MTEAQVRDALISRIETALAAYNPAVNVTYSFERGMALLEQGKRMVELSPMPGEIAYYGTQRETLWKFLVNMTMGKQAGTATNAETVTADDRALCEAVRDAINDDAGFAALTSAGVHRAECVTLKEDGVTEAMINPHVITCFTYE